MKVILAGAGAIGQFLGARLQDAGHDVTLLTTPRHVEPVHHLEIEGLSTWKGSLTAVTRTTELPRKVDAIIVTSKALLTHSIARAVAPHLASEGAMVTLQNGLGNAQKLAAIVPPQQVAVSLTSHGIMVVRPGLLRHAGIGATQVGPHVPEGTAAAKSAQKLFTDAGLAPEYHDEMRGYVWRKALINHAVNPVAALHGVPNGDVAARPDLFALSSTLLREGLALAQRARVPLPGGDLQQLMQITLQRTAANRVSMLQDVEAKRPTEIEQLTGRLVRLGERLLVSMPRSEAVYGRLKDLETSYLGAEVSRKTMWDELPFESEPF